MNVVSATNNTMQNWTTHVINYIQKYTNLGNDQVKKLDNIQTIDDWLKYR
jgi:hypothetical protein